MSSIVCYKNDYKDDQNIDIQALVALDGLNELLNESELGVAEEIEKTNEMAQQAFKEMKEQFAALLEENRKLREQLVLADSQQRQLKTTYQSEIAAWKEKSELSDKTLEDIRQQMADSLQKSEAEKKALIQDKERAVKITVEDGEARVKNIKQKIKAILGDIYFPKYNHWIYKATLRSMSIGSGPYCSCHKNDDPNNYYHNSYSKEKKHYPNAGDYAKWRYPGELRTRAVLAGALVKQIEAMENKGIWRQNNFLRNKRFSCLL